MNKGWVRRKMSESVEEIRLGKKYYITWNLVGIAHQTEIETMIKIFFEKLSNAEDGTYLISRYYNYSIVAEKPEYEYLIFTLYAGEIIPLLYYPATPIDAVFKQAIYFFIKRGSLVFHESLYDYPQRTNVAIHKIA
jgi:hypothetical protein